MWHVGLLVAAVVLLGGTAAAQDPDPLAANNGLYPTKEGWTGSYREVSLNYPQQPVASGWSFGVDGGPISVATAPDYVARLKKFLEPTLRGMIEEPHKWNPADHGWYDMVWQGQGSPGPDGKTDPTSGRDSLLNTYTGQIVPAFTWDLPYEPSVAWVQNHAVIYYNKTAAAMLGRLWRNLYSPDLSQVTFPEGSIVVKVEAVSPNPDQWGLVKGAAEWHVYRPPPPETLNPLKTGQFNAVESPQGAAGPAVVAGPLAVIDAKGEAMPRSFTSAGIESFFSDAAKKAIEAANAHDPEVLTVRAFQMSIAVKDSAASPHTGWVYAAIVYDATAKGDKPWDRFVPVGVMWGNDPQYAGDPGGLPRGEQLTETWLNPNRPQFTEDTLGWGGRLAGPMDVATRHEVITTDGKRYSARDRVRVSSCLSCHGSAEFPFTTNLYPSPNKRFPKDGAVDDPFLLYTPGSAQWARWFQNRPGNAGTTDTGDARIPGLDYDMVIMFALSSFNRAMGNDGLVFREFHGH